MIIKNYLLVIIFWFFVFVIYNIFIVEDVEEDYREEFVY